MSAVLTAVGVLFACLFLLWLVSLAVHDASIIDIFWGPAFGVLACVTAWCAHANRTGDVALVVMVLLWGLRLGGYLAWRNLGKGEDPRYRAMREKHGAAWWWRSALVVFALQGAIASVVSLPVMLALGAPGSASWVALIPGALLFATGLFFEAVADFQLARFKADAQNRGKVMDRGLWRYSRHPNYFGNFCVVWGLYLAALPLGAPLWTAIGPALMTYLLLRVSGVALLERSLVRQKADYADYVRRTSAFFPGRPR